VAGKWQEKDTPRHAHTPLSAYLAIDGHDGVNAAFNTSNRLFFFVMPLPTISSTLSPPSPPPPPSSSESESENSQ
jgi:hypothetical protein